MKGLLAAANPHRVVNYDETEWWIIPQGLLCWAPVGQEVVSVTIDGNDKDAITALASVTAASEKLPLFLIAKGRTPRVEHSQLGDSEKHWTAHSPSGWATKETFRTYLERLREWYGHEDPIHLALDCYSVHRSQEIRDDAIGLGIELHFIPAGWTDELQPLDRDIFGALKSISRRLFHRQRMQDNSPLKRSDAAMFVREAWEITEVHIIEKGWGVYEDVFGGRDTHDDDDDDAWEPEWRVGVFEDE
jgi:hypothetical protein